jgi:glyoxylase I family protein
VRRLHHVALGARDVERVAGFYRELIGLPETARQLDERGELRAIWLEAAGTLLMVERASAETASFFLLAFEVSPSERPSLEARLEAAGHRIEGRTPFSSYARDPEGNRVAISHYPERPVASLA